MGWRARSDLGDIEKLKESIIAVGQIHPIVVRRTDDGSLEVVAGVRRLTVCKELNINVEAVIVSGFDELEELKIQIDENVVRKDFDLLEVGEGLLRLGKASENRVKNLSTRFIGDASKRIGVSKEKVREMLALARLPEKVKDDVKKKPTVAQRNAAIRGEMSKIKKKRKIARIADRVKTMAAPKAHVEIFYQDNAEFFATSKMTFDCILTDPPYGQRQSLVSHLSRRSIDSNFGEWDELDVGWLLAASERLSEGGQILAFSPLEAIGEYKFVAESIGLTWRGAIVWHKTNPGVVHRPVYLSSVEAIVWITKGANYVFAPWENAGTRDVHNIIEGPICGGLERVGHPTQKPLWLLRRLIERHTLPGSMVLDPFAGVGSTLAACAELGRTGIGIERDAGFYDTARKRLAAI